ncbi:MAG: PD40 domain-containing protein [Candidatus Aminicenantes bacterium]|nr:MAG: PD40 domain-containing protein [Candidatus Aminicenantes bacterium]
MNADGTDKVRLTSDQEENSHPVWSKDGEWIYYQRNDDIYRMSSDGSNPQIVVEDGNYFDITDDGLGLVFKISEQDRDAVVLYDLEKGITEEIVPARVPEFEGKELGYPTISPDGKWLAFAAYYPKTWTTHIVKLDGRNRYQFASGCMPQFRPDGLMIAWITSGFHEVHLAAPDGKNRVPFVDHNTIPGRPQCYFPRWSNNGDYIVFAASPSFDWSSDYEIFIKSASGGEAVRLTFHSASDIWPDIFIPD